MRFKTADAPEPDQEFDKWIVKAGGAVLADETAAATAFIMPSVNVTVEATYKDKPIEPPVTVSHTVTFVVENGTWADGSTANKTVQVSDGSKLQAEAMPTGMKAKDGYENGVWIVVPDTTNPVTADVVYTYRFVEKVPVEPPVTVSHTVTFAVENGTWADDTTENKSVQVSDGDKLQAADIPVGMKAKDGYENGVWVVVPDTINPVTADILYTYRFIEKAPIEPPAVQKYKIVYDANGAKEAAPIDATEYTLGDKITVSSASMTRDGYIFQCWKNSLEYKPGDTFVLDEAIAAMASNGVLTLTAQWIPTPLQPL